MNYKALIKINSIIFIGLGIAFCLYAPLTMALFQITEIEVMGAVAYWFVVSFARLFGAMLFTVGVLLWAISSSLQELSAQSGRGYLYALILGYAVAVIAALTQQIAIWQSTAGWLMTVLFAAFLLCYIYFLFIKKFSN